MKVWCVRHKTGWCAVLGNVKPDASAASVATLCAYFVMLPIGIAKRMPDCPGCRSVLTGAAMKGAVQ